VPTVVQHQLISMVFHPLKLSTLISDIDSKP
jgi:hypothetical protein